jgi:hypothetical protein
VVNLAPRRILVQAIGIAAIAWLLVFLHCGCWLRSFEAKFVANPPNTFALLSGLACFLAIFLVAAPIINMVVTVNVTNLGQRSDLAQGDRLEALMRLEGSSKEWEAFQDSHKCCGFHNVSDALATGRMCKNLTLDVLDRAAVGGMSNFTNVTTNVTTCGEFFVHDLKVAGGYILTGLVLSLLVGMSLLGCYCERLYAYRRHVPCCGPFAGVCCAQDTEDPNLFQGLTP